MASKDSGSSNPQAEEFSRRLREAMAQRAKKISPTALEREFNLRYRGPPITVHSARKWLLGLSVPTQDKLLVLANWLDVSEEWLRWGEGADMSSRLDTGGGITPQVARQKRAAYAQEERSLIQDWRLLDTRNRQIVTSIMEVLLRDQRMQRDATRKKDAPAA